MGPFEVRLKHDIEALNAFAGKTGGRLNIVDRGPDRLRLVLNCRSATLPAGAEEPEVGEHDHLVDLLIPSEYGVKPVLVLHRAPTNIFHPNIASWQCLRLDPRRPILPGYVCYASHHAPTRDLVAVVRNVYDILGYRASKWSKSLTDCLNPDAVRFANRAADSGLFPLERRPLAE